MTSTEVLGVQARRALWRFATSTRLDGEARDRAALAMLRSRVPKALDVFSESALLAVLQEPPAGRCSWDNLETLSAKPTPELVGLLGRPCARCRVGFEVAKVHRRESAMLAAAAQHPPTAATGFIWPAGQEPTAMVASARAAARRAASKPPAPSYYQAGRRR